jgi:hypothetical protein
VRHKEKPGRGGAVGSEISGMLPGWGRGADEKKSRHKPTVVETD